MNCELAEVRGQLRDAKDQIDNLQLNFEHTDAWKPCDSKDQTDNPQPDFEHIDAWKPRDFKDQINNSQPDFEYIEAWKPLDSRFDGERYLYSSGAGG